MKFELMKPEKIKPSKLNPPQREKNVHKLAGSIKEHGLLQPIIVAGNNVIIDGHRRLMACKKLGLSVVPVIKHNSTSSRKYDDLFVQTNEHTQLMNGNQYLWRYMKGAKIPQYHKNRIEWIERAIGKRYALGLFERLLTDNKSANTIQYVMGIYCTYTNKRPTNKAHMRKLVQYLLNTEPPYRVKMAIHQFIPVKTLVDSVNKNLTIEAKFVVKS